MVMMAAPEVRQIIYEGVGGLKLIEVSTNEKQSASLKYDGSQYHLHIANGRAYALTSKRESKKTGMFCDRIENFPELLNMKFPFRKETIIVCEAVAEHLYKEFKAGEYLTKQNEPIPWSRRSNFVAGIMNANPETVERKFPDGNPLKLVAFSILYWDGNDIKVNPYIHKQAIIQKYFPSAGKWGEKIKDKLIYRVQPIKIADMLSVYPNMIGDGYIRNPNFEMEGFVVNEMHSNRSLKIKRLKEADCIVIGFNWESTGKYKENGWIKSIIVGCFINDNLISIKTGRKNSLTKKEVENYTNRKVLVEVGKISGFDESLRAEISSNSDKYLGQPVECEFHEWTGNAMRHPRISDRGFRSDKLIHRCIIDQME